MVGTEGMSNTQKYTQYIQNSIAKEGEGERGRESMEAGNTYPSTQGSKG